MKALVGRSWPIAFATAPVVLVGCVAGFSSLYPGMSSEQVAGAMGRGPTRTEMFEGGYTAWYYGENECVLMQNNTLVDKQVSRRVQGVETPIVGYHDKELAQCLPPGVQRAPVVKHSVYSPLGTVSRETQEPIPAAPPGSGAPPPAGPPALPPPTENPPPPPVR
jgi:hypothetical protein